MREEEKKEKSRHPKNTSMRGEKKEKNRHPKSTLMRGRGRKRTRGLAAHGIGFHAGESSPRGVPACRLSWMAVRV
jgi:hypothetical protein